MQRRAEGFFVPIGNDVEAGTLALMSVENELFAYFEGPPHQGAGAVHGISAADADFVDRCLAASWWFRGVSVDRARLADSVEAWVHVRIEPGAEVFATLLLAQGTRTEAVLIWANTD